MAEATVDSHPSCTSTFFCHMCQVEVQLNVPALTCSRCNTGFIEEMEQPQPPPPPQPQNPRNAGVDDTFVQIRQFLSGFPDQRGGGGNVSILGGGPQHRYNTRLASHQASRAVQDEFLDDSEDEEPVGTPSTVLHFNVGGRQQGQQPVQGIINYVLQRLGSDFGRGHFVHLHGNPGDYAWGNGGLDAIISELLNQLEGTGAPPAQKDTIENLPEVTIKQSHIDSQLQCSICMDDFEMNQQVKRLPCDHLYHAACIVRWLEMHGTCPVCRKDLNGEDTSTNETSFATIFPSGSTPNSQNPLAASSSSSSSSMDAASSNTDPSSSSSFSMDFEHNQ